MEFDFTKEPGRIQFDREYVLEGEPLLSIVTPYYNAHEYFEYLYPCVMNQTFPWFEWIIVNDGSTHEDAKKQLASLEERDSRIRVINKVNGGSSSARNKGIRESKTDIVVTLDADELIESTYFEVLYWALYYNKDCTWAYTDSVGFQAQEYTWNPPFDTKRLKSYNFLTESAAIRKKDLLEVGCYDEVEKYYYEDWRLWLKLLSKSKRPIHVNGYEFWYRRTESGALNKIDTDREMKRKADLLASEAAASVDEDVVAKTFDGRWKNGGFVKPRKTDFHRPYLKNKKKTQILFLIPHMVMGGADQFNLDFVRLIDKDIYDVTIISTNPAYNVWKQRFREYAQDIFTLPDFLDPENYTEFISYIIESRQVDVCLVSDSYYGYYLLPWLRKEYPELAFIDYVHMEEMYWREGGYARVAAAMADLLEKTYVCNGATEKFFEDYFGRDPKTVETLYIGVDYEKFSPKNTAYGEVRRQYGISDDKKIVLFPCRVHEQKRPYLMMEIAKETVKKNANIYFLVAGGGPELEGLKKRAKEFGIEKNVIFAGEQKNMQPFYRDSNLTLICSIKEGLALTAYESCAMMTPVVTADVGGQKELINEAVGRVIPLRQPEETINVTVYSKEEIDSYVDAILEILSPDNSETYEEMCKNCRERIIGKFGLDTMIQRMENAIDAAMSEERKSIRVKKSDALRQMPILTDEFYTLYAAFEYKCNECDEIWVQKCRLEKGIWKPQIVEGEWGEKLRKEIPIKYYVKKVFENISKYGVKATFRKVIKRLNG